MSETLWPSISGDEAEAKSGEQVAIAPSQAEQNPQPTLSPASAPNAPPPAPTLSAGGTPPLVGSGQFVPPPATKFQPTGTFVGQKIGELSNELANLQGRLAQRNGQLQQIRSTTVQNAQRYHATVAAVNARLQLGTTPGNPVLISQWNQAQADLDRIGVDIAAMNSLANEVAADSSLAAFLLESARATYGLSGAIDEDHRQLQVLEDETNSTVVLVDRLLNEISQDVARQTAYVSNERRDLTTLSLAIKNGELYGSSLSNRAFAAVPATATPSTQRQVNLRGRRPLVVIRFDRPDVPYEQALYTAMSRTLERRPGARFALVAVNPNSTSSAKLALGQSAARKNAQKVLRTLTDMGLPPDRITLSATTSPEAATNEVHIYVE